MRDARPEGSPYPKADLTLRGLARAADFALAWVAAQSAPQVGPILAAFYLLVADGLMSGQSVGKRIFGVRTVVVPRRAPAGWHESVLRNAPFALVAIFYANPLLWPVLFVLSRAGEIAHGIRPIAPAPPGSSATRGASPSRSAA